MTDKAGPRPLDGQGQSGGDLSPDASTSPASHPEAETQVVPSQAAVPEWKPDYRLYGIVFGLGVANLLAALENTVLAVAAPVILTELDLGDNFVWITSAFFLCSTAIQPLFGQFCNVFGRRYVMLTVVAVFMLGSGICGGASTGGMLIAGRAVQGVGSGGIMLVSSIVLSDLVPLRQRGGYSAILMSIIGVGSALGPFIGGEIVENTTWRWVFYLNLPIGGAAFIVLAYFLRVNYSKEMSFWEKLKRVDLVGNGLLSCSTVSILYALSYAGTRYSWGSWHTLVPLLIGFLGLGIAGWYESTGLAAEPIMPPRFFNTMTTIILAINTFLHSALLYWCIFFLPVYFQGVKLYSPERSGISMLPISLLGIPGSILGAIALTRWGRYKPMHILAFAIQTLGLGLFTMQDEVTSTAKWAVFQCIAAFGGGIMFSTMLPAFQAFISEKDLAACTAAWYFIRLFGHIWGWAIPASIFNNKIDTLLADGAITDPLVGLIISKGGAYQAASAKFVEQFSENQQSEIRAVYRQAIQRVFQVSIVFAGVACLLSLLEKEVKLRTTLDTEFGMEEEKKNNGEQRDVEMSIQPSGSS